jgi:hypothetical protein
MRKSPERDVYDETVRNIYRSDPARAQKAMVELYKIPPGKNRDSRIGQFIARSWWDSEGPKQAAIRFRDMIKGRKDYTKKEYAHVFYPHCGPQVEEGKRILNDRWEELDGDPTIVSPDDQRWIDKFVGRKRSEAQRADERDRKKKACLDVESARGRKQLQHNRAIAVKGGKATAEYTNEQIIAAFEAYKKHCGRTVHSLTRAVGRVIDPFWVGKEEGKAFFLQKITTTGALWYRLKRIASPLRPAQWWESL